jgi:pimeloyl-ACP methyl ester carboxylesterase
MSEQSYKDVNALIADAFRLYVRGEYVQSLDTATSGLALFPENTRYIQIFRAMLMGRLGQTGPTLELLRELIESGYFISELDWNDGDFDSIRADPEFARLRALSDQHMAAVQAEIRPALTTLVPDRAKKPLPLLLALHGNRSSVAWHRVHWLPAVEAGWLVALPQSSQVAGLDSIDQPSYSWNDEDIVDWEIGEHLQTLRDNYHYNPVRLVIGGFSRGAENAIRLALTGTTAARHFIAVCPGGPYTATPDLWTPIIQVGKTRAVQGTIITGGEDQSAPNTLILIERLRAAEIIVEHFDYPEMGHDYPPDFAARLTELLGQL